ncbi:hypothetical protein [Gordonia rhizosphera]|uniref:hypothetical protein n=1 Tax=Gordonia rhizosphera TaxID=83341 RepID=UPI00031175DA|nr:hypothetical protein [Gordonia rhizosphera]
MLRRPRLWKPLVALNAVAITVFLWHMTAYLIVVTIFEGLGRRLQTEPSTDWWAQRWFWLLAPLAVLVVVVAVFAPVERMSRRSSRRSH